MFRRAIAALIMLSTGPALGQGEPAAALPPPAGPAASADIRESVCLTIEAAARAHDLPLEFFARVIWQESRFQPDVVGPRTRSGDRAQGIAQFMPKTATERGLLDPFDPVQALPKSAEFLRELRGQFGNLGLAAAAYNAGPQRVRDWLAGRRTLPAETRNYVLAVTGLSVEDWAAGTDREPERKSDCASLMALLRRTPNPFVERLEERVTAVAGSPWGVALSAGFSHDRALAAYASIAQRHAQILSDYEPILLRTTLRSRGTNAFYQVRIGADTRAAANALCESMRRAGGACFVLRNKG
jgi:Transglycosylase SLT domain/SPOR domain